MTRRRKVTARSMRPTQADLNHGLEQAAKSGDLEAFNNFLERGASLDARDAKFNMLVIADEQPAILNLLTDASNGLYKQFNDGTTDLHLAAMRDDVETIEQIFKDHPERMLEVTSRGENVLNWANYFMRHKVISYLLSCQAFEDKLEQQQTDDSYYDLARGHELLADYFLDKKYLYDVPMYYEIAIQFYGLMNEKLLEKIAELESKLKNFKQCYPMIAPAAERGFSCSDVPGDGNCFFHAVADQLKWVHADDRLNSMELREKAIAYMLDHPGEFRGFCPGDLDEYIEKMVRVGCSADNLVILALSRALKLSFYILNSDGSKPIIIRQGDSDCLYLGYIVESHYQSLVPRDEKLVAEVEQEVAATEPDALEADYMMENQDAALSSCSSVAAESPDDLVARWDELWNSDWDDDGDKIPFPLQRQNAAADLTQLDQTVQPCDTVDVILQPEPVVSVETRVGMFSDVWVELGGVLDMVEDALAQLESAARQAGADLMQGFDVAGVDDELAKLKQAARELTVDATNYLENVGMAASLLVSQFSMINCSQSSDQDIEMAVLNDDEIAELTMATPSLSLSSSPLVSPSSSAASLGLTGLFSSSSGRSSPVNCPESPEPMRMVK